MWGSAVSWIAFEGLPANLEPSFYSAANVRIQKSNPQNIDMNLQKNALGTSGLLVILFVTSWASDCQAQHIFDHRDVDYVDMLSDVQSRRVGQLVTILIRQNTVIQNNDQRAMQRSSKAGGTFNLSTAFSGDLGGLAGDTAFDSQHENNGQFDGSSSYSVSRGFTDKITVRICRVMPNGNLHLAGTRNVRVAGEWRKLKVSGIVRLNDIGPANTIDSANVADFRVAYAGDGDETTFSNQGWLAKRLNRWLPF